MINTLLIANRGEIACRIIRTCQQLNIKTIALYAEPDVHALHVKMADTAHCVGPASLKESYLNIDKIIAIAQKENVDAIHPGYGFLSENAAFAQRCLQENIVFVGPSPDAIRSMAVKDQAKKLMQAAKVPTIPGCEGLNELKAIQKACLKIGYPIILKAASGGGGKGMRIVREESQLEEAIRQAKKEALNAFGDDTLFFEKYLVHARHIEVQIFRDTKGQCVHLFERDCSTQRRHQKIIEEAPAIRLSQATKEKLYQSAIQAAHAINYVGAGTIEFLVDEHENYYFMEMNTRLQVEHPVTEMITDLDLVAWQLKIAEGEPLPCQQNKIKQHGHAIEARIYSEDPAQQFLPQTGKIKALFYKSFPHTRLETGIQPGDQLTIHFDPLMSKCIAWGETREKAIQLLSETLRHYQIVGVKNNIAFTQAVLESDTFAQGIDVQHLEKQLNYYLKETPALSETVLAACGISFILKRVQDQPQNRADPFSPWQNLPAFKLNLPADERLTLLYHGTPYSLTIEYQPTHFKDSVMRLCVRWDASTAKPIEIEGYLEEDTLFYHLEESWHSAPCYADETEVFILHQGHGYTLLSAQTLFDPHKAQAHELNAILSPMPGVITQVWATLDSEVKPGDKLMALEAMKMEHTIQAPKAGKIKAIHYQSGDLVTEGSELIEFH